MTYKIIGSDQREYGPVGPAELRQWLAEGRVNAQSMVLAEGATNWRPLGSLPELAGISNAPAPLPIYTVGPGQTTGTNGMAVAGFVLGLFSWVCCCAGPMISGLALVFSIIGLIQISQNPMQGGKGLAIAGIILAILGLFISAGSSLIWLIGASAQH